MSLKIGATIETLMTQASFYQLNGTKAVLGWSFIWSSLDFQYFLTSTLATRWRSFCMHPLLAAVSPLYLCVIALITVIALVLYSNSLTVPCCSHICIFTPESNLQSVKWGMFRESCDLMATPWLVSCYTSVFGVVFRDTSSQLLVNRVCEFKLVTSPPGRCQTIKRHLFFAVFLIAWTVLQSWTAFIDR